MSFAPSIFVQELKFVEISTKSATETDYHIHIVFANNRFSKTGFHITPVTSIMYVSIVCTTMQHIIKETVTTNSYPMRNCCVVVFSKGISITKLIQ